MKIRSTKNLAKRGAELDHGREGAGGIFAKVILKKKKKKPLQQSQKSTGEPAKKTPASMTLRIAGAGRKKGSV